VAKEVATIVAPPDVEAEDVPTQDLVLPAIVQTTRLIRHHVEGQLPVPMEAAIAVDPTAIRVDGDVKTFQDVTEELLAGAEEQTTVGVAIIATKREDRAVVLPHHAAAEAQTATANDVWRPSSTRRLVLKDTSMITRSSSISGGDNFLLLR